MDKNTLGSAEETSSIIPNEIENPQKDTAINVIDSIIWQIQTGTATKPQGDPIIPEGQDPSLTEDALEAAFSMLSGQVSPPPIEPNFILPKI